MKQRPRKIPNEYVFREDCLVLAIKRRNGETFEILLDHEDFHIVSQYHWHVIGKQKAPYVRGRRLDGGLKSVALHRVVMWFPSGKVIDHINHNIHDNRKRNLRVGTIAENNQNLKVGRANCKSGERGICWSKRDNRWLCQIRVGNRSVYQRKFADFDLAVTAIREARQKFMPFATN